MDSATFKARAERLQEVAKLIESLPPEIRSQAFALLTPYITGHATSESSKSKDPAPTSAERVDTEDRAAFFTKFPHDKPASNVYLLAAYWYDQHGTAGITIDGVRKLANEVGLTIPARPDVTLKGASKNGNSLFTSAGYGAYKPTVHGEAYFKATYAVTKGTKPVPRTDAK
jgi:hypothetical protein